MERATRDADERVRGVRVSRVRRVRRVHRVRRVRHLVQSLGDDLGPRLRMYRRVFSLLEGSFF